MKISHPYISVCMQEVSVDNGAMPSDKKFGQWCLAYEINDFWEWNLNSEWPLTTVHVSKPRKMNRTFNRKNRPYLFLTI